MQIRSNSSQQLRAIAAPLHPWESIGISDKDYTALVDTWSVNEVQGTEAANRIKAWLASDRNQVLNLAGLGLTSLPPLHVDLKKLNAANNLLTSLPAHLPPLVELNVRGNQLKRLPEELPTASLQMLNAVGNNLESVPANFHWFRPGCEIYLEGNILLPDIQAPVGCLLDIDFFYELTMGSVIKVAASLAEFPNAASCIGSTGESPLLLAVQKSNIKLVKLLIAHPLTDVNRIDDSGNMPLISAILSGDDDMALLILQRPDIDINKCTSQGITGLHLAVTLGRTKVVQRMLASPEINPNQPDCRGQAAIHFLILKNDLTMFRLLLTCPQVNLDEPFANGTSIAGMIADVGHSEILESLLDKVAVNQERQQKMMSAALFSAAENGKLQIAVLLLRKYRCDPDSVGHDLGAPALCIAAQNGHIDVVKLLLRFNADPMKQGTNSPPALLQAMAGRNKKIFELLLALPQIDPNVPDASNDMTPLYYAAQLGLSDYAMLLMQHKKIDINRTSQLGQTPLLMAVLAGQQTIFEPLMQDVRIDVNKSGANGFTPLHAACLLGFATMARQLMSHEAIDLFGVQRDGAMALNASVKGDHLEIVEMMLDAMQAKRALAKLEMVHALGQCVMNGTIRTCRLLMERFGITVHDMLPNELTLLHLASRYGQPDIMHWLLEQGADASQRDFEGKLPLQRAAENEAPENGMNLLHLLKHGASVKMCGDINEQRKVVYAIGRFVINELITVSENLKQVEQVDSISMTDNKAMQSKAKKKLADAKELLNLLASMKADVLSTVFAAVALSSIEDYDFTPAEHPWLMQALDLQPARDPESRKGFYASVRKTMELWDGQGFDGAGRGLFSVLGTRELSRLPPLTRCLRERWGI